MSDLLVLQCSMFWTASATLDAPSHSSPNSPNHNPIQSPQELLPAPKNKHRQRFTSIILAITPAITGNQGSSAPTCPWRSATNGGPAPLECSATSSVCARHLQAACFMGGEGGVASARRLRRNGDRPVKPEQNHDLVAGRKAWKVDRDLFWYETIYAMIVAVLWHPDRQEILHGLLGRRVSSTPTSHG